MLIKILEDSIVLNSNLEKSRFEKIKKLLPESLTLKDEKEKEIFKVDYKQAETATVNNYGITLNAVDENNNLLATFKLNELAGKTAEEKKNIFLEQYIKPITAFEKTLAQMNEKFNELTTEIQNAEGSVTIV